MAHGAPIAVGQTLANKYLIEGVLGEGGMGVVVAAWHLGLDQRVAIKLLLRGLEQESSALERFQREARTAARVRSEHVCRVLDTGALDDGTPFLVMEYLEGQDLAAELAQRGCLPVAEAVALVSQACDALQKAHEVGIVHRDLKPANLFLQRRADGTRVLKVLDFGVSKSFGQDGPAQRPLTKTASVVGSPIYMSPEQLNSSRDVDGRTDVWALGTILYELIAGRPPFFGESLPQLVSNVLHHQPEPLQRYGAVLPGGLEEALLRALRKSRDERYPSVEAFARALAPFAPNPQVSSSRAVMLAPRPPSPANDAGRADTGAARSARPEAQAVSRWSMGRRAALALCAGLAAAGAALLALSVHEAAPPHAPAVHLAAAERDASLAPRPTNERDPTRAAAQSRADDGLAPALAPLPAGEAGASSLPKLERKVEQGAVVSAERPVAAARGAASLRRDLVRPAARTESKGRSASGITDFGGRH